MSDGSVLAAGFLHSGFLSPATRRRPLVTCQNQITRSQQPGTRDQIVEAGHRLNGFMKAKKF
jgi:hypothetical protein